MWQNADFLDAIGSPIRIVSLDVPFRHADGQEVSRANLISDGAPSVVTQLARVETQAIVSQFVNALPKREREIVRRVFWDGETQTAVAADLGVSKMAVSKVISKITKRGREALPRYEHLLVG
jgi:RNA polymerase sigma factor (sigma-70 family)